METSGSPPPTSIDLRPKPLCSINTLQITQTRTVAARSILRVDIGISAIASTDANADGAIDSDDIEDQSLDTDEEAEDEGAVESFSNRQMLHASAVSEVDQVIGVISECLRKRRWFDEVMM